MIVHSVKQNTPEWLELRLGIPTASEFGKILTPKTMALSAQSKPYLFRLLGEWMTGQQAYSPETDYMQIGHDLEDRAVSAYCLQRECEVEAVGFITRDDGLVGCSPDRLVVGRKGGVEIKTHPAAIGEHVRTMVEGTIDATHKPQTQGQMWLAELDYVDVVSYCGLLPTVIIREGRDEKYIASLKDAMDSFIEVMLKAREDLVARYGPPIRSIVTPQPVGLEALGITEEHVAAIMAE
jgi:hypothetical protein